MSGSVTPPQSGQSVGSARKCRATVFQIGRHTGVVGAEGLLARELRALRPSQSDERARERRGLGVGGFGRLVARYERVMNGGRDVNAADGRRG